MSGPNNPNWRGGLARLPYPWDFNEISRAIIARDGGRCQNPDCRGLDPQIVAHHINYDKADCRHGNLIALCSSCNSRANFGRQKWLSFYAAMMAARGFSLEAGEPRVVERFARLRLTEEDIVTAVEMRAAGATYRAVGERIGCTTSYAHALIHGRATRTLGSPRLAKGKPVHPRVEMAAAAWRACAEAGMSAAEAAVSLGRSERAASEAARKHGLQFRKRDTRADWQACVDAGMSRPEAASVLGFTRAAARHAAQRYGLQFARGRRGPRAAMPNLKRDGGGFSEEVFGE